LIGISSGARVSSFFWIQSMVRDDGTRRLLFDLDSVTQHIAAGDLNPPNAVKLTGIYHNLLRRWAEA
jgi:PKHD-type hydroxylase